VSASTTPPPTFDRAKARYRDAAVAGAYDSWRYETPRGRRRNRRDLAAIGRALDAAEKRGGPVRSALDLPCGTGRLAPFLGERAIRASGADVSMEMLRESFRKLGKKFPIFQCSADAIPLGDGAVDAVFAIRFLFHLDRSGRAAVLAEMARVSRRWLVLDVRHRYNLRWVGWRIRHALGLLPEVQHRFSRAGLDEELAEAGIAVRGVFPSRRYFGWASDKWTVLGEKRPSPPRA
jgi:ubiquinone/menaquinone biosynthesis C-methylase UbiE